MKAELCFKQKAYTGSKCGTKNSFLHDGWDTPYDKQQSNFRNSGLACSVTLNCARMLSIPLPPPFFPPPYPTPPFLLLFNILQ